jgi:hypothetical protein
VALFVDGKVMICCGYLLLAGLVSNEDYCKLYETIKDLIPLEKSCIVTKAKPSFYYS